MNLERSGEPVRLKRLVLLLVALAAVAVPAFIFLPAKLVQLAVVTLVALPFMIIIVDKPRWMFYIFLVILLSNIDIFMPFRSFRVVLMLMVAAFALAVLNGRRIVVHDRAFIALVAAFLILAFSSLAVARDFGRGAESFGEFVKVLINIALMIQFVRDRAEFRGLFLAVAVALAINNFLPIVFEPPSEYANVSLIWTQGVFRYEGFELEPNTFASLQIFFIPILLFLTAYYRRPHIARLAFLALLGATIFMLILTFSRSGFVSLAVLLLSLLVVERRNHMVLVAGLSIIAVAAVFAPSVYWERISTIFSGEAGFMNDYSIVSRLDTMRVAIILGLKNPFLGVGMENFIYASTFYLPYTNVVHNAVLQIFADLGFGGLAILAAIVAYNFRIILSLMRRGGDPEAAQLGRMLLVQHVAVLVNSLFLPITYHRIFWITLCIPSIARYAYAGSAGSTENDPTPENAPPSGNGM
ncbi:MAG TPA: O-antigen ligase family protein [Patescibacteria group bacterium]|nr:O-antigen ligase family protein [Patescibacteria group bacterium]